MATAILDDRQQRLDLTLMPWHAYKMVLQALEGRHLRITYDSGRLEIMTLSHQHEFFAELLGHLVVLLATELRQLIHVGGSTTFTHESLEKGLEPDKCYWFQHAAAMRGKMTFDVDSDPPPDLAIEIDISRSSMDRMKIYAALKVPEIWRYDGENLTAYHLSGRKYKPKDRSAAFPGLVMNQLASFLRQGKDQDVGEIMRQFSQWVRQELVPAGKSTGSRKNGK
jgi:Uma2 family endonuclease